MDGYRLDANNKCEACTTTNAKTCTNDKAIALTCMDGYYPTNSGAECSTCVDANAIKCNESDGKPKADADCKTGYRHKSGDTCEDCKDNGTNILTCSTGSNADSCVLGWYGATC